MNRPEDGLRPKSQQHETTPSHPYPPAFGRGDLIALAGLIAAVAWIFRDVLFRDRALFYFDISEINYPYRDFLASEWRAGRFSRWHPGLYCGMALFSESQAGYFHPLKFLYLLMPTWRAFNLDTVLSSAITLLGAYGWLRRHVGPAGAAAGAATFGLGGFFWAHLVHTSMVNSLASVPLAFWALESTWDGGRFRGMVLGAFALACQVFAGHLQDTLLTGTALGLYTLYRAATEQGGRRRGFVLASGGGLLVLGVVIAAIQWIPSKELIDRSPRSEGIPWEDLTYGSWSPELLPTMLIREAYGTRARDTDWMDGFYPYHEMDTFLGVTALALAVVGAAAYRDRWVAFWILLAGLALALMLGRYTFLMDRMTSVPFLGRGRIPVRYHLWFSLAIAALAAVGVDRLSRPGVIRLWPALGTLTALVVVSLPILWWIYTPALTESQRWPTPYNRDQFRWLAEDLAWGSGRLLVFLIALAWVMSRAKRSGSIATRAALAWAFPTLIAVELIAAHPYDVPTVPSTYWTEPPETARAILDDPDHERIVGLQLRSLAEPGYASGSSSYFESIFFRARETLSYSMAPAWGLRSGEGVTPIIPTRFNSYTANAAPGTVRWSLEGVSHFLMEGQENALDRIGGGLQVVRNEQKLPRLRFLGRPVYADDRTGAARSLKAMGDEARDRILVEDPTKPLAESAVADGQVEIVDEIPEQIAIRTEIRAPGYLFLADTFDPGWSATIDGRPAAIVPAYVNFRGVFLPEGDHEVVFRYEPAGFRVGLAITAVGLAIGALLGIWPRRVVLLDAEHTPSRWSSRWPWAFLAILLGIVAASAVRFEAGRGIGLSSRWDHSWHRFTWSSGLDAMKPPPPPVE